MVRTASWHCVSSRRVYSIFWNFSLLDFHINESSLTLSNTISLRASAAPAVWPASS